MSKSSLLKLDQQICHRLYQVSNALVRAYRPLLQGLDLTYPQYLVMLALWEEDKIDIKCLIERTKIDGGALTQILKKMSAKGLLTLSPWSEDKRVKKVALSKKGRELKDKACDIPSNLAAQFPSLSSNEFSTLTRLLDKVIIDLSETST